MAYDPFDAYETYSKRLTKDISDGNFKLCLVEWPNGSFTLAYMGRSGKGSWSGSSIALNPKQAKRMIALLKKVR